MGIDEAIEVLEAEIICRPLGDQELLEAIKVAIFYLKNISKG